MQKYTLPRHIVNTLLRLAQSQSGAEICGLISKDHNNTMVVYPIKNIASSTECFFEMDPVETISAMKSMREQDAELFAIFHSHPHSPAYPSKTDIEQSGYPEALYLIISLDTTGVLELKGFRICDKTVVSVDLIL